ncbi:MAG: tetratricopeptide repeat protein [Candidatus Brocadiia bacterium]
MRPLLLVLVGVLVVGGVVGGVLVYRAWRARHSAREQGKLYFKVGQYDRAIACFKEALESEPEDPLLLRGMARCYRRKGDLDMAAAWAREAAAHDPTSKAHVLAAEIANLRAGHWEPLAPQAPELTPEARKHLAKAREHARQALAIDPHEGTAYRALAETMARLGELGEATRLARRAVEEDSESHTTRVVAAQLVLAEGNCEEALAHCTYVIERTDPADMRSASPRARRMAALARRLAVEIYGQQKRYEEAIARLKELLALGDDPAYAHVHLAKCYLLQGEYAKVVEETTRAEKILGPKMADVQLHYLRGCALMQLEQYHRAVDDFGIASKGSPEDATVHAALGMAHLRCGQRALAQDAFLRALEIDPDRLDVRVQVAELLADEGELQEALWQFRRAIERAPRQPEPYDAMLEFCIRRGLHEKAERELMRLFRLRPDLPDVAARLCELRLREGDGERAALFARRARAREADNPRYLYLLAQAEAARGNYHAAHRQFARLARLWPKEVQVYLKWASTHEEAGQEADAEQVYQRARRAVPGSTAVRTAYAQFLLAAGRDEEGRRELRAVIDASPAEMAPRVALADHYLEGGRYEAAQQVAEDAVEVLGDSVSAYGLLARVHRASGRWEDFLKVLGKIAEEIDPDAFVAYQRLAAYIHAGAYPNAVAVGEDALQRHEQHRRTITLDLAAARFLAGRRREALDALSRRVSADELDADAGVLLSLLRLAAGEQVGHLPACRRDALPPAGLDAWAALARRNEHAPDTARRVALRLIKALVYENSGWHDTAAAELEQVLEFAPDCQFARILLPLLMEKAGRRQEAIAHCEKMLEESPQSPAMKQLLADLVLLQGEPERARQLYARRGAGSAVPLGALAKQALLADACGDPRAGAEAWRQVLRHKPEHLVAKNNLAWHLAAHLRQELDTALDAAAFAQKLEPEHPAILDTVGWVYYQLGEYEEAIARLQAAVARAPHKALYHYHLGMAYREVGKTDQAITFLRQAVDLNAEDPLADRAHQVLRQLRF